MIEKCIKDLQNNFNNYIIYIHNLSYFDSVFLLKILHKNYKANTLFKDGKSISIIISNKIKNKKNIINLNFKDSIVKKKNFN
jgi:hypothetical protein